MSKSEGCVCCALHIGLRCLFWCSADRSSVRPLGLDFLHTLHFSGWSMIQLGCSALLVRSIAFRCPFSPVGSRALNAFRLCRNLWGSSSSAALLHSHAGIGSDKVSFLLGRSRSPHRFDLRSNLVLDQFFDVIADRLLSVRFRAGSFLRLSGLARLMGYSYVPRLMRGEGIGAKILLFYLTKLAGFVMFSSIPHVKWSAGHVPA